MLCADSSPFTRPRLGPKAKIPNHDGTRLRFARDSPLEEAGFEPSVPPTSRDDWNFGSATNILGPPIYVLLLTL